MLPPFPPSAASITEAMYARRTGKYSAARKKLRRLLCAVLKIDN